MNFKSDNVGPISADIMQAIIEANQGNQPSYGADEYSVALKKQMSDIFEKEVLVYLTSTGTAANSLALASLVRPYETIYCNSEAHINTDECAAPEFYTGGSKLVILDSDQNGKIDISDLNEKIQHSLASRPHGPKPGCISITQATESGTVYTTEEVLKIHDIVKQYNMPMHLDGARFANSLVTLNCTPAEITWKAGVDVMSFGATKNGALCAEAIVFFNHKYAKNFDYLHKRAGQLMSKSRFFACQLLAYLKNDLWLKNASSANSKASQLAEVFTKHNFEIIYPVEANELFVKMPAQCAKYLQELDCKFYDWSTSKVKHDLYRFVTSCFTTNEQVIDFAKCLDEYKSI